jgi:choline dehydrogenase-like flavoprotein
MKKQAIVVGSGAGGAAAATALQGAFDVTVLEAGGEFSPFALRLPLLEKLRRTGMFLDERMIQILFPPMRIQKTRERMVVVSGIGHGGTTTLCAGNAVRRDADLKEIGIDLDAEFRELFADIPVTADHRHLWKDNTKKLFDICVGMKLDPRPLPKMGNYARCRDCGRCILGCASGVKWDSRRYLQGALAKGARLVDHCRVMNVAGDGRRARGVFAKKGMRTHYYPADLIVLAAGGLHTPIILERSGIPCQKTLFVDPVLCVAAELKDSCQDRELSMPFVVQREHYIISPYFDYLSFFFNRRWKHRARDTFTLMIKLADENRGGVSKKGIDKPLTETDNKRLAEGVALCRDLMARLGIDREKTFLGTLNAGHPGGMLPLSADEARTLHHPALPENLYVVDASLLPRALGNPPSLTIMALAKKIANICRERFG